MEIGGVMLMTASPEDVLIAKMEWSKMSGSDRQLRDAVGIVRVQRESLDRAYVDQWATALGLESLWRTVQEQAGAAG